MRWPVLALLVACTVAPIACSATADNATAEAMRKVIDDVAGPEEMQSLLNWALGAIPYCQFGLSVQGHLCYYEQYLGSCAVCLIST